MLDRWRHVRLLDVVTFSLGQVDPRESPHVSWPLLSPNHVESGTGRWFHVETAAQQRAASGTYAFQTGDVIYCKSRPHLKKAVLADGPGLCSSDMYPLRPSPEIVPRFLLELVLSERFTEFATSLTMHTGIPTISRRDLGNFSFALPPLDEQRRIAVLLSAIDDVVEHENQVAVEAGVVRSRLLDDLSEDLSDQHASLALDEVAFIQSGVAKNKTENTGAHERPYLSVANIQDGYLDLSIVKTMLVDDGALQRFALHDGDVLFCARGDADKVGRGTVWRSEIPKCLYQNHVLAVRPDPARLLPEFLSYYRSTSAGRRYLFHAANQTTNLATINSSQLRAMPVPLPPLDEQRRVVTLVDGANAYCVAERRVVEATRTLKQTVAAALLSGSVRSELA